MTLRIVPLLLLGLPGLAHAVDVDVDGAYQTRARLADTLSLNRSLPESEGFSYNMTHRLWVRPKFFPTERVGVFADILALDNVRWGSEQVVYTDPVTGQAQPGLFDDAVRAPTSVDDADVARLDLTLWRAWAEAHTGIGTFRLGRMPMQWGMGIWQNDGLGVNDLGWFKEYGDSVDRFSWEHLFVDALWLQLAIDLHTAGLINRTEETWDLNAAAAYRSERIFGGLLFQYRRSNAEDAAFDLFTLDGSLDLRFGVVRIQSEFLFQFGGGDLAGGLNDVDVFAAGGAFDASVELDKVAVHAEIGWATGDDDPNDTQIRTFSFDRDYNVGQFLFEEPMPVLASDVPGEARNGQLVAVGDRVSNTIYLRPRVTFQPIKGLKLDGQFLAAFIARASDDATDAGRAGPVGYELDLGLRYEGLEHLSFGGVVGVFIPDTYLINLADGELTGFGEVAAGGTLFARVAF